MAAALGGCCCVCKINKSLNCC